MSIYSPYTGYVYLWYDTRAKLFYLGGHHGKVEDSYVCSNEMMKRAYKKRPETFRFRVLEYVYDGTKSLRKAEQKWLDKIQDHELYWTPNIYNKTVKYYNKKKHSAGGNGSANKGKSHPAWNKGYTKEEVLLRKNGMLCFLLDRPKSNEPKSIKIPIKVLGHKQTLKIRKQRKAWNKGISNPLSAKIGKMGAKKQSQTVTGRRISVRNDGSRYWVYPDKNGPVI